MDHLHSLFKSYDLQPEEKQKNNNTQLAITIFKADQWRKTVEGCLICGKSYAMKMGEEYSMFYIIHHLEEGSLFDRKKLLSESFALCAKVKS